MYEYIIIGAGLAGLYAAYKLKKTNRYVRFLVLEKNPRHDIGGRVGSDLFYGTHISKGAGIGRADKNPLLITLCRELGVHLEPAHTAVVDYSQAVCQLTAPQNPRVWYLQKITEMRRAYRAHTSRFKNITFRQFGISVLGIEKYHTFVIVAGYSDFENADVYETLYNYSMDDNTGGWQQLNIPWFTLLNKIVKFVGPENIRSSAEVVRILGCEVYVKNRSLPFVAEKIVVATTIDATQKLVRSPLYNNIYGQPFLRVYVKFDARSTALLLERNVVHYIIVTGPLQKIIPISPQTGVYMIAYSDNASAVKLHSHTKEQFAKLVERALDMPRSYFLKIIGMKVYYWTPGTHYFGPLPPQYPNRGAFLKAAQHPTPNVLVVGEAVSTFQGWVEGALESVETVL